MWHYHKLYQGSTPAEQNHSSVKSYPGRIGTLSLLENVQKLFACHIQHTKASNWTANDLFVNSFKYTGSRKARILNLIDRDAEKKLSAYAYIIHKKLQRSYTFIQSAEVKNGIITCKLLNTDDYTKHTISWNENAQCPCSRSHDLDFQCEHELKHDGCFLAEKFGTRWLQNHVYNKMHSTPMNPNAEDDYSQKNVDIYHNFDDGFNTNIEEEDEGGLDANKLRNGTVLLHKAMYDMADTKFARMEHLIDSNKKLQSTFISALDQFINRTRNNE